MQYYANGTSGDGLQHWKFIKKWRENGKWRYVYPSDKNALSAKKGPVRPQAISRPSPMFSKMPSQPANQNLLKPSVSRHKYVAKVSVGNGKYRYFYSQKEYDSYKKGKGFVDKIKDGFGSIGDKLKALKKKGSDWIKSSLEKAETAALETVNKLPEKADQLVKKVQDIVNKIYDDPNNIYDITRGSYKEKIQKISQTKEWQDIVARKDPEYVKTDADGKTHYLIDKYAINKKHPVLDALGDIAEGRDISTNKIDRETVVAGLKDYAYSAVTMGMLVAGLATKLLTEKFKLHQGSYDDEIAALSDQVSKGYQYVVDQGYAVQGAINTESVKTLANTLSAVSKTVQDTGSIDTNAVIDAAKLLTESSSLGSTKSFSEAEKILANLSDEEVRAIAMLISNTKL